MNLLPGETVDDRAQLHRIICRELNYGTVVVTGVGGTDEPCAPRANPLDFRRQVRTRTAG